MMSAHRPRSPRRKPLRLRAKSRRPEPLTPFSETAMLVLLALLMWIVLATMHAGLAGAASKLPAPKAASPADGATVGAVPWFSWMSVRRAAQYEFQLSADAGFRSLVLSRGRSSFTHNT